MTMIDELRSYLGQRRAAVIEDVDAPKNELLLRAAPYDVESHIGSDIWETFAAGTFARAAKDPARLGLWADHDGPLVGRGIEADDRADGFYMRCKISQTTAGKDLMIQVDDGTLTDASVEFVPMRGFMDVTERGGEFHIRHRRAHLRGAAIVFEGAHSGAQVVAMRDAQRDLEREKFRLWFQTFKSGTP